MRDRHLPSAAERFRRNANRWRGLAPFELVRVDHLQDCLDQRPFDASTVYHALGRVLEKHGAQRSAAVDAVSGHPRDRRRPAGRSDDLDREAASTLRGRRRRRKEEDTPFYSRVWFQIPAILGVLGAIGLLLYFVFRPASPGKLYAQAKKLMESKTVSCVVRR